MAELSDEQRERLAETLAGHHPDGIVSSREGWVECECGEHLPLALDRDGYALDTDAERAIFDAHRADALAPVMADMLADAERERDRAEQQADIQAAARIIAERERDDLRSRLACVSEASYWDRPYDTRIAAIRGMCDLTTNGMTPATEEADQ